MPYRLPKFSLKNICSVFVFSILFSFSSSVWAFPDQQKSTITSPTSQATSFIRQNDRYLFLSFSNDILRIDTDNFALSTDQIPALTDNTSTSGGEDLTGDIAGLAIRNDKLYASQADGDLIIVDLSDITATPDTLPITATSLTATSTNAQLGGLVADTEAGEDNNKLYILDKTNDAVIVYDITADTSVSIPLVDSLGSVVSPASIAFVEFPTGNSSSTADKIYVTTSRGIVFEIREGSNTISNIITLSLTNKNLLDAAVTPDGNFLLVVDATDNAIHVIDTATDVELDMDSGTTGTNPLPIEDNSSLKSIVVSDVSNPTDTYAYVTGSSGVTVVDLNLSSGVFNLPDLIDITDTGGSDTTINPIELTSPPGPILSSSSDDRYIYTSNGNASISIITENPFVTISSTSLGTSALTTSGTFTLTFQSDETGTYQVRAGGDQTGTGTLLTSGTVSTADTDVTTDSIAYSASTFSEGKNRIYVFVTDSDSLVGRSAVDITVDTPPTAVTLRSTDFGNERVYVTFDRLDISDIDHYNVYVDTDSVAVLTATTATKTVSQPSSGSTIETFVDGLVNSTPYFIAVEAVDASDNVGPRTALLSSGAQATATPERTGGLAAAVGEPGCSLISRANNNEVGFLVILLMIALFYFPIVWMKMKSHLKLALFLVVFLLFDSVAFANEASPQWFSLEFKGGAWLPLNSTTKDFLGTLTPFGKVEFGFLYHSRYGVELGLGVIPAGGHAVGTTSGSASRDSFSFNMLPIEQNFTYRIDYKKNQLLVPYVKAGLDEVLFRESTNGNVTKGTKLGLHMTGGLQILLDGIEDLSETMEKSLGVNHIYFTVEGRYGWINGFGGTGVNLSNLSFSGGMLFEF